MTRLLLLALLTACTAEAPPTSIDDAVYLNAVGPDETLCEATYELGIEPKTCLKPMLCTTPDPPRTDCYGCLRWRDPDGQTLAFGVHLGTDFHSGYCRKLETP
jgi:hypothetical protein